MMAKKERLGSRGEKKKNTLGRLRCLCSTLTLSASRAAEENRRSSVRGRDKTPRLGEKWQEGETSAVEVCWKCFFGASPSHKPQQLSSTAHRNAQEGQLPDHRRGERHAEVRLEAPTPARWLIHKQKRDLQK